jgi:hypothetical protein
MNFKSQESALSQIETLSKSRSHSILISGNSGSGKTYLSMRYAELLNIEDTFIVKPVVGDIRDCIDTCYNTSNDVVIVLENADTGVQAVFSSVLKFLEEPAHNVYVIVTCRNLQYVPDTIISRCSVVSIMSPTESDILLYAKTKDSAKYDRMSGMKLWKIMKSFSDVDYIYSLTDDKLTYLENTSIEWLRKLPVSNSMWKLNHYGDNSNLPPEYPVRMIMNNSKDMYIRNLCLECLDNLQKSNIAAHATLGKFVLEIKYTT